jgi:hypothetical protein
MQVTVRRLMTSVLVLGLLIGSMTIVMRWAEYRRLALQHEEICDVLTSEIEALSTPPEPTPAVTKIILGSIPPRSTLEEMKVALAAERRLAMKYREAANHPWMGVARGH